MDNAIGYARISMDRSGEGGGVERQSEDIRQLAKARGWKLREVVVENDVSAAGKRARPGFERVLDAIQAGKADVVVAWALDRLTRNRRDTVRLIEACQAKGATIALVRGTDLDMSTPAGRLMADLLAAVARAEIETKSDRQRRANEQAVAAGKWRGGRRPFGYEADGVTIRTDEAAAVRDAFRWILAGVSLAETARRWNARGFTTPQGKRGSGEPVAWNQTNISRTMRNARYAGLRTYRGEVAGKAEWPAIVDQETFLAVQAILRDPSRRPMRGDRKLLTGVAVCGICGATVWAGGGAPGRGIYRCRASMGHFSRKRDPVDEYVSSVVAARLSRPDAVRLFERQADRVQGPSMVELSRQVEEGRAKMDALAAAFADGAISVSQLRTGTERLRRTIAELEAQMVPAGTALADVRAIVTAEDVAAAWDALSVDAQRRIIDALMVVTLYPPGRGVRTLNPDTVKIEWR